jgi:hypothetical protein
VGEPVEKRRLAEEDEGKAKGKWKRDGCGWLAEGRGQRRRRKKKTGVWWSELTSC